MSVPSSLSAINELTKGYQRGIPTGLFGTPMSGKSTLLCQETFSFVKTNSFGTIYVGTEGAETMMFETWQAKFQERFSSKATLVKLDIDYKKPAFDFKLTPSDWDGIPIIVANLRAVKRLLQFFGLEADVGASEKGKFNFRIKSYIKEPVIRKLLDEYNIECIVIDSLTSPLNIFVGGLVNYPARADAAKGLFNVFQSLADDYNPLFLVTHHTSKDPKNQYAAPDIVGGKIIRHYTKISYYIEKSRSTANQYKNRRTVYLDRWFDKPRLEEKRKIELKDIGFVDIVGNEPEPEAEENASE